MRKIILALIVVVVVLCGCEEKEKEVWKAYVFPDKNNPAMNFFLNDYKSLDFCREAAEGKLKAMQIHASGTYECRKNCKEDESGRQICEQTYSRE